MSGERSKVVDQLSDINPTYVNKYFLPKLADATATVTSSHIKQHQEYNLEKLKNLAVPLVKGLIVSDDETDLELISNFEESMNNLGLVTKDRSDLNKTIVNILIDQAEAVGLSGNGDIDAAEDILDIAKKFPYGVDGKLNLTAHPDYQSKVNDLKKSINNYIYEYEKRKDVEQKRKQREETIQELKRFADTGNARILTNLMKKYPLDAPKISTAGVALDGTTLERSAQLETNMIAGKYESAKDASLAALQWYQDPSTPKTVQNRNRLTQLLDTAESVERGDYTEINKGLTELLGQLKGEFSGSEFIISNTGQLNDNGSRKVTDFYNKAKLELYQYRLSEDGRNATTLDIINKIEEVKSKYIEEARKLTGVTFESGKDDDKDGKKENDMSDIQGDAEAGAFTPSTPEDEARERRLDLEEDLDKILKGVDKTKKISQPKINEMLLAVGFTPEQAKIMAAVAMAESAGDPMIDTVKSGLDPEKKNEFSIGLFQLNMIDAFLEERLKLFGIESTDELYDPIVNVIAAKRLYDQQGLGAWSAYNNDSYKKFLTD